MNESQLRDRLAAVAAATTTDRVAAWDRISAGRRRPSVARRLVPVGALALGVAAVVLAVNIAGDGSRITATGPGAANLPNRPPAIEGSVYGLVNDRSGCPTDVCPEWVSTRVDLADRSVEPIPAKRGRYLTSVQFEAGKVWGLALLKKPDEPGVGIGELVGSELVPLESLRQPFGGQAASFAIAEDGRIAWTSSTRYSSKDRRRNGLLVRHLFEFDPRSGRVSERLRLGPEQTEFGGIAYGPDGLLAVAEIGLIDTHLVIRVLAKDERSTTLNVKITTEDWFAKRLRVSGTATVSWSKTGLIAVSDSVVAWGQGDTHIIDAATGKLVRTIKNAHAQAWSPDGTGILVVRSKTGRDGRLSVAYGPGLAKEKVLGSLPDALTLQTWVAPETPKVEAEQSWPLWPEHSSLGVRAAEAEGQQPWRADPTETALRFGREVLGWKDARATGSREIRDDRSSPSIAVSITNGTTDGVVYLRKWSALYYSVAGGGSSKTMEESFGVQVVGRHLKVGIIDFGTPKVEVTVWYGDHFQSETFGPKRDVAELDLAFPTLDVPATLLILWRDGADRVVEFATAGWPAGDFSAG